MKCCSLVAVVVGCGGGPSSPPQAPLPPEEAPATSVAAIACVPAGAYKVTVDLGAAKITQVNTGMDDTRWCESMLAAIPAAQMAAMRIGYDGGVLAVHWPPSRKVSARASGECAFTIPDEPIPATITFAGGRGEGIATYSLGTVNHPDEKCTATNAKLVLERTGD